MIVQLQSFHSTEFNEIADQLKIGGGAQLSTTLTKGQPLIHDSFKN